ncbi:MAG: hypothetical protein AAFN44_20155 [Pseudomonadota bacterium]
MEKLLISTILASSLLFAPEAQAKETIVVVSPFAPEEVKQEQIRDLSNHIAEITEPGETSYVLNGWTQETIARFHVPEDEDRYARTSARMRANPEFFRNMKEFAEERAPSSTETQAGQIDWPAVMRRVGRDFPAQDSRDLIFYEVSPVYHDVRSPEFSMRGGTLFSDAHLDVTRDDSPFGARDQSDLLSSYTVHWGLLNEEWAVSDRHAFQMERAIALSVEARGSVLSTFASGGITALENAANGISAPIGSFPYESDGRPVMIRFQPEEEIEEVSIYDRPLSDRSPSRNEFNAARDVEIAIRWDCNCDFDLAVQVANEVPISFRAPVGVYGTLFKDFTSSQSLNNGWETIAIPGPVDLQSVMIAVNQYRGGSGGAEVELRLAIGGETWGRMVRVDGPADRGSGFRRTIANGTPANAAWDVVPPGSITTGG